MAIMFGLAGLSFQNPFLLLIALFVWIGAESEAMMVEERVLLKDVPVRTSMLTEYHTVTPEDTLGHAADLLLAGSQQDFPVVSLHGTEFEGVLTRSDLMTGLTRGGPEASVADFIKHHIATVEADSSLAEAVTRLRAGHGPASRCSIRARPSGCSRSKTSPNSSWSARPSPSGCGRMGRSQPGRRTWARKRALGSASHTIL